MTNDKEVTMTKYEQVVNAPRIPKGMSAAEATERLSLQQKNLLAYALLEQTREPVKAPSPPPPPTDFKRAVDAALAGGVHVAVLSKALKISRARVYQIRDEMAAARARGEE